MIFVDELFQAMSGDRRAAFIGKRTNDMWCHMWATDSVEELHAMARKLGLKQDWFQDHRRTPHYDLTPSKRLLALKAGAEEMAARDWALFSMLMCYDGKEAKRLQRARDQAIYDEAVVRLIGL